jgi:hypothetical protein
MDTFISLFALVWLVPCAIAAVCMRKGTAPWSLALLGGCALAEVIGGLGGAPTLQISAAIVTSLAAFFGLDVMRMYERRQAEQAAYKAGLTLSQYLEQHPHLYAKTGVRRPVAADAKKTVRRKRSWFSRKARRDDASADIGGFDEFVDTGAAVEVITPAERAVLRREAAKNGFWIAEASHGEIEVFLPPGAQAYPGRKVTVVAKPNGTLMGV